MAEEPAENANDAGSIQKPAKSKIPLMVIGATLLIALVAIFAILFIKGKEGAAPVEEEYAEYVVPQKVYQLKDGGFLNIGFSIVFKKSQLAAAQNMLEKEVPGRLPSGMNLMMADKTREELLDGLQKREAFARELKKMIEERVFGDYNRRQGDTKYMIEVREVLISSFMTQAG